MSIDISENEDQKYRFLIGQIKHLISKNFENAKICKVLDIKRYEFYNICKREAITYNKFYKGKKIGAKDKKKRKRRLSNDINQSDISPESQVSITGQTVSYVAGDDGELQVGVAWPDPRFTDLGDGTVADNHTGLVWAKAEIVIDNALSIQ